MIIRTSPDYNKFHATYPIYLTSEYLECQEYENFLEYESDCFLFQCSINEGVATSISKSPFGSIYVKNVFNKEQLINFLCMVESDLKEKNVSKLIIKLPSSIYQSFIDGTYYTSNGYDLMFEDINQHIILNDEWETSIHQMQKRKLNSLKNEGFEFRKLESEELEIAHQFITACRLSQGLEINIAKDLLLKLNNATSAYDVFGVFRDQKMSSVCICVKVTSEIAYYYLPATSPLFRNKSPMVLLIAGIVDHYYQSGFKYFDLGISSIEGKTQETLKIFKERMGGINTLKPVVSKNLI